MAKPATVPTWATNTNYVGGPQVGTPTKTTPGGTRLGDGWRKDDVPPAQEQNWFQNWTGQWLTWVNSLALVDSGAGVQIQISGTSHVIAGTNLILDSTAFLIAASGSLIGVQAGGILGVSGIENIDTGGSLLVKSGAFFQMQGGSSGDLQGPLTFSNTISPTGSGKILRRRSVGPTSGTVTVVGATVADVIVVDPTAGNVIIKIDPAGTTALFPSVKITLVGASNTTNTVDVQTPSGVSLLLGLTMQNSGTNIRAAEFMFNSTTGDYNMIDYSKG